MKGAGGVDKELVASIITKIRKDILGADVDEPTSAHAERKVCRHEVHAVWLRVTCRKEMRHEQAVVCWLK
jgi:hypothetical protein